MSSTEMIDICNESMEWIGTASRRDIHLQGLWHQTFQCWVLQDSPSEGWRLLFQLRHKDKEAFPNLLDISCAGHLLAGETVEDGLRELKEELGLDAGYEDLYSCGIMKEENRISPVCMDREFCHVFLLESRTALAEYDFQQSEVTGLFLLRLDDFAQLLNGVRTSITAEGILLRDTEVKEEVNQEIFLKDIVQHSKAYYPFLLDRINRWLEIRLNK
jgi:isopentenyldiphosphate isomerase